MTEGATVPPPAVAETHTATLFLVGDRVYKRKKPVAFPFLDFRTVASRREACHREVELNRRLAPDVYLGVADVEMDGTVCDHLVVMRRMPDDRRLATMVAKGQPADDAVRAVARLLARFHATAAPSGPLAEVASRHDVSARWIETVEEMRGFGSSLLNLAEVQHIADLAARYTGGRKALFDHRIATGEIRDGHGDLLADDIFMLDDGPRVLDCLEFDDRLRHGDVLADVAFLAMDLERLGAVDLSRRFLAWYREYSGETWPESLAHHYIAYRAAVRAKVACARHAQGDPSGSSADQARLLTRLCLDHLERGRVRLVLVGGLPGTGKTTLASGLAAALDAVHLSSDETRKELAGIPADRPVGAAWRSGLYAADVTSRTYCALLNAARRALGLGQSVVLDASWADHRHRMEASALAEDGGADLTEVRCVAPADVAAARITGRAGRGGSASDATAEIAEHMRSTFDQWPEAVEIDTVTDATTALDAARRVV